MAATHYFSLYALDIIHHHCGVSGLYYTRLSFRWYGDFGPIPHVVLSLSVAQGGLTLCISLVSISVRGLVPLHNACSYGHYEVAELLVKVIHLRECFTGSWCMKDLPVVWNVIHLFTPLPSGVELLILCKIMTVLPESNMIFWGEMFCQVWLILVLIHVLVQCVVQVVNVL